MEEEIAFVSDDGLQLTGTLERFGGNSACANIMLLSGSGPQDRDETIAGKKPLRRLSHALVSQGFNAFRWDDRGVGASQGDYLAASASDLVNDVRSAMRRIASETGVRRTVLLGHSQGTLIAAKAAATFPDEVLGIGLLAGMGLPGRQVLLAQHETICRADGWPEDAIAASLRQKKLLFDAIHKACASAASLDLNALQTSALKEELSRILLSGVAAPSLTTEARDAIEAALDDLMEWEWRFLLSTDPAEDLLRVTCRVFAMIGDQDVQVEARANLISIAAACSKGLAERVETVLLPDHNHLFQETGSGALSDYAALGEPFSNRSLSEIVDWCRETAQ